jgi:hypothetical protein
MALRGIIPWSGIGPAATTFQQAIAESDLKTKWTGALRALETAVPTNGEISSLLRQGWIDAAQATRFYANNGVDGALAALYIESATIEQIHEDKIATKGELLAMYEAQLISQANTLAGLAAIGYTDGNANELLALADFRRKAASFTRVVQQIGRQVITGKVTPVNASTSLHAMGVPSQQVTELLNDWALAKSIDVPAITASQIASAVYYGVETPDEGWLDLQAIGYTPYDAWRLLSNRLHGKVKISGYTPVHPPRGTL